MQSLAELIDAIADDLASSVALPDHAVWKYVEPPVINPAKPLLAIFPKESQYDVLATNDSYTMDDRIAVAWYVPIVASPETGGSADPSVAQTHLANAEALLARVRTYAPVVPGVLDENEAVVERSRYGIIVGSTTWAAEHTIKISRWAG